MNPDSNTATETQLSGLHVAVSKQAELAVSIAVDRAWVIMRSRFIRYDPETDVIQILYPIANEPSQPPEITVGDQLGISFRRGHKKCLFVSTVVTRRREIDEAGEPIDTLVLRPPEQMRELQRRVYQRVLIPATRFIAVKIWEAGVPKQGSIAWPLCAGRVANVSVGGVLVDIRTDQNPRLDSGEIVGIEITKRAGQDPILADGQYRHCQLGGENRLGLGFQFIGLEHNVPERSSITEIAEFVRSLRRKH